MHFPNKFSIDALLVWHGLGQVPGSKHRLLTPQMYGPNFSTAAHQPAAIKAATHQAELNIKLMAMF
jgi:hypothetical protein